MNSEMSYNSSVDNDINEEIEDLLCYQNKIIVDDDYTYICKNGEISWYESHSNDEDDPWQLDELDGVSLFDTDNPRLIRINGSLFQLKIQENQSMSENCQNDEFLTNFSKIKNNKH